MRRFENKLPSLVRGVGSEAARELSLLYLCIFGRATCVNGDLTRCVTRMSEYASRLLEKSAEGYGRITSADAPCFGAFAVGPRGLDPGAAR